MKKLPPKRQAFVDAYTGEAQGNASEAARIAGYKSPGVEGCRLLKDAKVQKAIRAVLQPREQRAIQTREERQEWLTRVVMGEVPDQRIGPKGEPQEVVRAADRLKAAELLAKMQGDFAAQRHDVTLEAQLGVSANDPEALARALREELEALEGGDDG